MGQILAGTSGFSYPEWRGSFYEENLATSKMLAAYAAKLPTVEINNTFYRMPKRSVLESWCEQTENKFHFSIKASRRITHQRKLRSAEQEVDYLLTQLESLGDRLGAVLFQLPPSLRRDDDLLASFLQLLPSSFPAAIEFRHESWLADQTLQNLVDRKVALVLTDDSPDHAISAAAAGGWSYARLRKPIYSDDELNDWCTKLVSRDRPALVYFKHEEDAGGPEMALRMLQIAQR